MKSVKSPEYRITIKVGLIFLVVILFFAGLFTYSSILKKNIDAQNRELDESYRVLLYSDHLISSIQNAQDALNRYLVSPGRQHRQQYDSILQDITEQVEIIKSSSSADNQGLLLEDIDSLLNEKSLIVNRLLGLFKSQSPLVELDKRIETIDPVVKDTTVVITNVDTIVVNRQRKDFWSRLGHLINPKFEPDTTFSITHTEREARAATVVDTVMYADLRNISEVASKNYTTQIGRIERQVRELVLADQYISLHISKLISQFYNETIQSTRKGTENSEMLSQKILTFAITVGALSILLILIITFFISNDLNKGKKARIDLAKEKQITEDLIESRHKLLLSVSHDIKTPLSSMMGYMEIWDSEESNESRKRQLKSARNSGSHILSLLTNLLEFSRLEQKSAVLHMSVFNIIELVEEILNMFRPFTESKNIYLEFNNKITSPYYIESDYTVLKQILVNVISNSVKYTLKGGVKISVNEFNDKKLIFSIEDTGVGISKDDISKIFKPFSRLKNSSKSEGSGFGLYVTKGLTESLNGEINLRSELNNGTNVEIKLPVKRVKNVIPISTELNLNELSDDKKYNKILIFEDDIPLGNLIKEFLIHKGFKVKLCSSTKDIKGFINIISSFDIVFTDMQMIEYSGTEILRDIRENNSVIPVWLMTANDEYSTERAVSDGFSGFIKKPIHMYKLLQILHKNKTDEQEEIKTDSVKKSNTLKQNNLEDRFPQLSELFPNDYTSIKEILADFVKNSERDRKLLTQYIENDQFAEAQQLCHKIHPFYSQLNADSLTTTLRKMDSLRGHDESSFPEWQSELKITIKKIEEFTESIKNDFLK